MKLQFLRKRGERCQGVAKFTHRCFLRELYAHGGHVAVGYVHAIALRAYQYRSILDRAVLETAEQLDRFGFDLFVLAADERNYVVRSIERRNTGISGAGEGLHRSNYAR